MPKRALHLIAYDIADSRRRSRALGACKAHGIGGQKSVHECLLSQRERSDIGKALRRIMASETDRLLILRMAPQAEIHGLGQAMPPPATAWFYVG
jgi:CRISPR-associated protein Cas2